MRHIVIIIFFYLFLLSNNNAQITLSGIVLDSSSMEPLMGATVQAEGTNIGASTDFNGSYQLNLPKGDYRINYSYLGFKNKEISLQLSTEDSLILPPVLLSEVSLGGVTIVVTDGKYSKKVEESSVSIDVIDAQMIESNNATSLDQLVQKNSGVKIMDNQISIRSGAGYAYGVGSRVAFLVDGQPLLSAELSDVKWNFMPIENAEQIEVIKGSASVLYGTGALNGVINLRTAYPKGKEPYTAFSLYAGIYDQPRVDSMRWYDADSIPAAQPMFVGVYFAHRQRLHPNFDLVLGGNFHLENSFLKDADERRFRFNFNTRYRVPNTNGKVSLGINGNMMYHRQGVFFLAKDMMEGAYTNISPLYGDRYGSITLDPYLTIFDNYDNKHDIRGRWFNIAKHQPGPDSDAHIFSVEYQFQRKFKGEWILTAGLLGQFYHVNSILFGDPNASYADRALFSGQSVGVYAQVDKKFWNRLAVTVGARWEGFFINDRFLAGPPIFRAGLNLEVTRFDFLRASFGQGFRIPSFGEMFINEPIPLDGPIQLGIFPNYELEPERGWTAELAYRRTFQVQKFNFYVDLALFWMEYQNMIEFALGAYPQGFGFRFNNVSNARIAGWEISAQSQGKIGKVPLKIWGGYTFSFPGDLSADTTIQDVGNYLSLLGNVFANGIDRTPNTGNTSSILKYRSLHTFRMDIEAEYKGVVLGFAANFSSFIQNIDDIFSFGLVTKGMQEFRAIHDKGAWIFDLRLGYKINPKQRINVVIQNLLNEEYASRPARMGAPRSFSLKYSHKF